MPDTTHARRCEGLLLRLEGVGADAFYSRHHPSRAYLSGFFGTEGAVLITRAQRTLFVDSRYTEQARRQAAAFDVRQFRGGLLTAVRKALPKGSRVAFEDSHLSVSAKDDLAKNLTGSSLVPTRGLVEAMRLVKDPGEVDTIRSAIAIGDAAIASLLPQIRAGMTEREVAALLEWEMRAAGGDGTSFPTIVAAGERGAMAHALASDRPLTPGDAVVIDFGTWLRGYCSDLTRTVFLDTIPNDGISVLETVRDAQLAAIKLVRPGVPAGEVDRAARVLIDRAGYGPRFGHGLGHGIGLDYHEAPGIVPGSSRRLVPGMVFSIEPGIYLPGRFGVRIEDIVLVTTSGCEVLSRAPKGATIV